MLQLEKSDQSAAAVVDFLSNWFLTQTTVEDRLFAEYYHRQGD